MPRRVAICAVAQTKYERDKWHQRVQGMAWEVVKQVVSETGLDFSDRGIEAAITVSDDVFDARTISDSAMTDVVGAHFKGEEKVAADGSQAVYYGLATILSGHHDVVIIVGHCKESQPASRNMVTNLAFDPFFTRPLGLDYLAAAALQAQAYMRKSSVTEKQLAEVVVRSRKYAAMNPVAQETAPLTVEQVLRSPATEFVRDLFEKPTRQLTAVNSHP